MAHRRCGPSAGAGLAPGPTVGAAAIFVAAASLTVLTPLPAAVFLGPERSARTLKSLETWLLTNLNTITVILLAVLSTVMLGNGFDLFR